MKKILLIIGLSISTIGFLSIVLLVCFSFTSNKKVILVESKSRADFEQALQTYVNSGFTVVGTDVQIVFYHSNYDEKMRIYTATVIK